MMNITLLLAVTVLCVAVANFLHWRGRSGGRFLYYPNLRWLRVVFMVWTIATVASAILFLTGTVPGLIFMAITWGLTIAYGLYSIARRQKERLTLRASSNLM
jgi:hypothetical protein